MQPFHVIILIRINLLTRFVMKKGSFNHINKKKQSCLFNQFTHIVVVCILYYNIIVYVYKYNVSVSLR